MINDMVRKEKFKQTNLVKYSSEHKKNWILSFFLFPYRLRELLVFMEN